MIQQHLFADTSILSFVFMTFMTHSSNFETTLSGKLMIKLINKHFLSETDTNSFEKRTDIYSMYSANKLFIKCEGET